MIDSPSIQNLGKPKEVVKLNEQAAIELGSDILGEMVMFLIAATTVVFEYNRQSRKSTEEKSAMESRLMQIEASNSDNSERNSALQSRIEALEAKVEAMSVKKK